MHQANFGNVLICCRQKFRNLPGKIISSGLMIKYTIKIIF
ncbi:Uncharacterized protein dnl_40120 [Desulfonema limicola]|uniref:Uncharacterized protein n=1 Tax=Desulfonema limicola TaxID=45656 RepID=A0A975BAI1_9BACT|nr:Uncharacterized protein dnl_40120 [Desulfonema limicola]